MRMCDVSCDGIIDEDGSVTLELKVTKLTLAEAQAIGDAIKGPFRAVLTDVLSKGGTVPTEHRDMLRKPQ